MKGRPPILRRAILFLLCAVVAGSVNWRSNPAAPAVRVENVRRAFFNGEHNAFTDLIRWRGRFWLTFRSCPDGHGVFSTSSIIVLCSDDAGGTWTQAHRFSVPLRDTRDPHFLAFGDKLFVYTGTWFVGEEPLRDRPDMNRHLGFAAWTGNGRTWEGPQHLEGTYGHYIWRAASHGRKAYLCGRRVFTGPLQAALLESEDGLRWRFVSLFQEAYGNETAFLFEPDGRLTGVSRSTPHRSVLTRSLPPYQEWVRRELPLFIGGPLLARWGGRLVIGGRRITSEGPRTVLYWLAGDELVPFAPLPSGGDNSYPGFVELDDGRGLVSWYSSHEEGLDGKPITAIYLGELVVDG
jgi:hypothetical protein